jgi:alcohol dehydrogenase
MFNFCINTRICFGSGSRKKIFSALKNENWNNTAVVVDHNICELDTIKETLNCIKKMCKNMVVGKCTMSEPTYRFLDEFRKTFEGENIQVVIGIGGGSAMDTAKAVAVLINNKKPAIEYRGFNMVTKPVLPIVQIPTTAGTGSEITPNASFVDERGKRKMGINGEIVRPKYAFLDPELTLSCPKNPTISAGADSIVHAVEAYVAKKSNPIAKIFAKEGLKNVFRNLPLAVKEPSNIIVRENVMYGAFLAGIALMNSGTGPAAALSYPLGVYFNVPHGIGGGMFLPYVVEHNVKNGCYVYAGLYDAILGQKKDFTDREKSQRFTEKLFSLWSELSVPKDLKEFGLSTEFIPRFIKETMDLKGALDQNPVPFYKKEIECVLKVLMG